MITHVTTTLQFIVGFLAWALSLAALFSALVNRANDRLAEGLIIGLYLGSLGTIGLMAVLSYFGALG
jgi:hypothetical protein